MMKRTLFAVLLVLTLLVTGCGGSKDLSKLEPQELVKEYYESLLDGDAETARKCLSEEAAQMMDKNADSDLKRLKEYTDIVIKVPEKTIISDGSYDQFKFTVDYTDKAGRQSRVVLVSKKDKESPWKITDLWNGELEHNK